MRRKTDFQRETHYVFRRHPAASVDLRQFLALYEPARLSSFQLRGLFGRLSIEIEGALDCGDLATFSEGRRLIRGLHFAWPWAGFFLDLGQPLDRKSVV